MKKINLLLVSIFLGLLCACKSATKNNSEPKEETITTSETDLEVLDISNHGREENDPLNTAEVIKLLRPVENQVLEYEYFVVGRIYEIEVVLKDDNLYNLTLLGKDISELVYVENIILPELDTLDTGITKNTFEIIKVKCKLHKNHNKYYLENPTYIDIYSKYNDLLVGAGILKYRWDTNNILTVYDKNLGTIKEIDYSKYKLSSGKRCNRMLVSYYTKEDGNFINMNFIVTFYNSETNEYLPPIRTGCGGDKSSLYYQFSPRGTV